MTDLSDRERLARELCALRGSNWERLPPDTNETPTRGRGLFLQQADHLLALDWTLAPRAAVPEKPYPFMDGWFTQELNRRMAASKQPERLTVLDAVVKTIVAELYQLHTYTEAEAATCIDAGDLLLHMIGLEPRQPSDRIASALAAAPLAAHGEMR